MGKKEIIIEHLGKIRKTTAYAELTKEQCNQVRKEFFQKPNFDVVEKEMVRVSKGGVIIPNINQYYFFDLMAKVRRYAEKWTIEEFLQSDKLIQHFYGKTITNKKIYPDSMGLTAKIKTVMRIAGSRVATKPAKFPIKKVYEVIDNYNTNGNYYDFSCGWGDRLLGALSKEVNYFGTDPNYLLVDKLISLVENYKSVVPTNNVVDIRSTGSEVFVPEWENTMGFAFSSPPYFNLEDYVIGDQSFKTGTTLNQWLDNYLRPTVINIRRYLIKNGTLLINIKDYDKYKLVKATIDICSSLGFRLEGTQQLNIIDRVNPAGLLNNNEGIFVFKQVI